VLPTEDYPELLR